MRVIQLLPNFPVFREEINRESDDVVLSLPEGYAEKILILATPSLMQPVRLLTAREPFGLTTYFAAPSTGIAIIGMVRFLLLRPPGFGGQNAASAYFWRLQADAAPQPPARMALFLPQAWQEGPMPR